MNPTNQFVQIAPDCQRLTAVVPPDQGKPSIATIEYRLLSAEPYRYTLQALKFAVHATHKRIPPEELATNRQALWNALFAKPCACMRASPLTKLYGWGAHYDEHGKIAIYAVESPDYPRFVKDSSVKKYFAMRAKRA